MSASTDVRIKQRSVIDFLTDIVSMGMISSRILPLETNPGFIIMTRKKKAIHGISSSWFSECQEIQNRSINKKSHAHHLLGCKGRALQGISD
jgi:hypothetical protein